MPFEDCNVNEFSDVLIDVECLLLENVDCHYIIGGDLNTDFSRNSIHTALLRSFSDTHNLLCASELSGANIDFSYHLNMSHFSLIDNLLLSLFLFHNILKRADVVHDINNLSDHEPIVIELCMPITLIDMQQGTDSGSQKVSWAKANDSHIVNYRSSLADRLKTVICRLVHLLVLTVGVLYLNIDLTLLIMLIILLTIVLKLV
jgi:hypothetical protein